MARRNKVYDDDDGRTIADMSEVSGPSMFLPRKSGRKKPTLEQNEPSGSEQEWDPKDRRIYVFGALRAALLIALVYAVGFALIIGLLLLIWKH
jgi:hypothetical protein